MDSSSTFYLSYESLYLLSSEFSQNFSFEDGTIQFEYLDHLFNPSISPEVYCFDPLKSYTRLFGKNSVPFELSFDWDGFYIQTTTKVQRDNLDMENLSNISAFFNFLLPFDPSMQDILDLPIDLPEVWKSDDFEVFKVKKIIPFLKSRPHVPFAIYSKQILIEKLVNHVKYSFGRFESGLKLFVLFEKRSGDVFPTNGDISKSGFVKSSILDEK